MEWKGIRFYKVMAESKSDKNFTSTGVNLNIEGIKHAAPDEVRIDFSYSVEYKPDIAVMRFDGYLVLAGKKAELEKLVTSWKKERIIPKDVAEPLVNIINFNAETNGVLVAKAINIVPPLLTTKISMDLKEGASR